MENEPVNVAERVFQTLTGTWTLTRVIHPDLGTATGTARFTPMAPGRLHYREDVELHLPSGHVGPAFREYEYVLEDDLIRVLLANGTTMHLLTFEPETAPEPAAPVSSPEPTLPEPTPPVHATTSSRPVVYTAQDIHDCVADQYRGTYRLHDVEPRAARPTDPSTDPSPRTGPSPRTEPSTEPAPNPAPNPGPPTSPNSWST